MTNMEEAYRILHEKIVEVQVPQTQCDGGKQITFVVGEKV